MRTPLLLAAMGALVAPVASADQLTVASGDYIGKGRGVTVAVTVAGGGDTGRLNYAIKTRCGAGKGVVPLSVTSAGVFKGKWASGNGKRAARVLLEPLPGTKLSGIIRYLRVKTPPQQRVSGKAAAKPRRCRVRRSFLATYDFLVNPDEARAAVGHYAGTGSKGGLPVDFDVSYDPARPDTLQISDFSFETETECWEDLDDDGADDRLVAKVAGLSGEVDSDGDFYIDENPNEDNEYEIEGTLHNGKARMEITVGGFWATDGTPSLVEGPLECDSWGEIYAAIKKG